MTRATPPSHTPRLRALLHALSGTSRKINAKQDRVQAMGSPETLKPSLFRKLTQWMDQIFFLKSREERILRRIEAVEEEHRLLRKADKLRKAEKTTSPTAEAEPKDRFWTWLILALCFASKKKRAPDAPTNG